eukprot:TRINITY_DN14762_c2_g3_i1.p1 TRINITY_DN14762_c2_g3~~TRINITY_DN14762_c2_g3_i1.p1  ORF type:complete len:321 (-),score=61.24 TRINITY_DN14762_c2_g3_i1:163-1125(-)
MTAAVAGPSDVPISEQDVHLEDTSNTCSHCLTELALIVAAEENDKNLSSLLGAYDIREQLKSCEARSVQPMLVAQGLRILVKVADDCDADTRLNLLFCLSEQLSKVEKGKPIPYRWEVLGWYVKMWWAAERMNHTGAAYSHSLFVARASSSTRLPSCFCSAPHEMTELEENLFQFLSAFTAYASEAVLLSGLEFKNVEVLLEAFAEAILEHEELSKDPGLRPMTNVAQFSASGKCTAVDGSVPSGKDVLQYMMMLAMQTSTEHKVVQQKRFSMPKRKMEDLTRTAEDYGLRPDVVKQIYKIIREHPIRALRPEPTRKPSL